MQFRRRKSRNTAARRSPFSLSRKWSGKSETRGTFARGLVWKGFFDELKSVYIMSKGLLKKGFCLDWNY